MSNVGWYGFESRQLIYYVCYSFRRGRDGSLGLKLGSKEMLLKLDDEQSYELNDADAESN